MFNYREKLAPKKRVLLEDIDDVSSEESSDCSDNEQALEEYL